MALLLNIDTATNVASVSLTRDGNAIVQLSNTEHKEHGSFINVAIQQLFKESDVSMTTIDAVAVTIGPGSYTGLRVGLATAKGLCYALDKPLIVESTLKVMAVAAQSFLTEGTNNVFLCPMIDARRMEVFTALYDKDFELVLKEQAMILDEGSFSEFLKEGQILFFGNGSSKFKPVIQNDNALFENIEHTSVHLGMLAEQAFASKKFTDVAYAEPQYLKEFFTPSSKMKY